MQKMFRHDEQEIHPRTHFTYRKSSCVVFVCANTKLLMNPLSWCGIIIYAYIIILYYIIMLPYFCSHSRIFKRNSLQRNNRENIIIQTKQSYFLTAAVRWRRRRHKTYLNLAIYNLHLHVARLDLNRAESRRHVQRVVVPYAQVLMVSLMPYIHRAFFNHFARSQSA